MKLEVDDSVSTLGIHVCCLHLCDLHIERENLNLKASKKEVCKQVRTMWNVISIGAHPHIVGYRELYERVGAGNEQLVPSCEALVRMILKSGVLPTINTLVDIYNMVSATSLVDIGAHDIAKVNGNVRVSITTGSEHFVPLGKTAPEPVKPGEYAYLDNSDILCRLDVRQCDKTKILPETSEAVVVANSNGKLAMENLRKAAEEVARLAQTFLAARVHAMEIV